MTSEPDAEGPTRQTLARRVIGFDQAVRNRIVSQRLRLPFGVARLTPELPMVYDMNFVEVDRPVALLELLPEVDRVSRAHGLLHRKITTTHAEVAWTLTPALVERGWTVARLLYMVHDAATPPVVSPIGFGPVDLADFAPFAAESRAELIPGIGAEVIDQLAAHDRRLVERVGAQLILDHDRQAGCHVYRRGPIAQIEDVAVLARSRGQGLATGLLAAAHRACGDAELVFLVAEADDWPHEWYRRLGFHPVASAWSFSLRPADPTGG